MPTHINLNNDWHFTFGEQAGAELLPASTGWYDIGLPHSFGLPDFRETAFYVGYGCYRRTLTIEPDWAAKRIALEFQGVFQRASVYVNGTHVGGHEGGYTPFIIDISRALHPGDNDLFVRVDNNWDPRIAPRAGDYSFNGGIYRDVALLISEPTHIDWHGVAVTPHDISHTAATLTVETEIINDRGLPTTTSVRVRVKDPHGNLVTTIRSQSAVLAPHTRHTAGVEVAIFDPYLWHPDHPHLYEAEVALEADGIVSDISRERFGIRWFEFTAEDGFFLNGEQLELHGANVHQDHGGWGDAVTQAGLRRDVEMIKDLGMNIIRGSHYPHHLAFTQACDELGVLYWSELPFWGVGGDNIEGYWFASAYPADPAHEAGFEASCRQTLEEMIRTERNSPSIIVWSVGNEVFFSDDHVIDKAKRLTTELVDHAHALDPTRPVAVGGAQRRGFDILGDIAGYNGDGAELFIDPGIPNIVSEYHGAGGLGQGDEEVTWQPGVLTSPRWRAGKILWCGYHYRSVLPDAGTGGIVDYFRVPRRPYYWYREQLRGIPRPPRPRKGEAATLRLTADVTTIPTDGTGDAKLSIEVLDGRGRRIDAEPDIHLTVVHGPGLFPTGTSITLSPSTESVVAGATAIEVRAYRSGSIIVEATADGIQPAVLELRAVGGKTWDPDEKRILAKPAPTVAAPPAVHGSSSLTAFRPARASSALPGSEAANVTSGDEADRVWRPIGTGPNEWVEADLEFAYEISRIRIDFADDIQTEWIVETTTDHHTFVPVHSDTGTFQGKTIDIELAKRNASAVRIRFPQHPRAVARVDVY